MEAGADRPRPYPPQTTGTIDEAVIFEVPALEKHLSPLFTGGGQLEYEISWYVETTARDEPDLTSPLPGAPSATLVFCVKLADGEAFAVALRPHLWPILDDIAAKDTIGLTYHIDADGTTPGVLMLNDAADGLAEARDQLPEPPA